MGESEPLAYVDLVLKHLVHLAALVALLCFFSVNLFPLALLVSLHAAFDSKADVPLDAVT